MKKLLLLLIPLLLIGAAYPPSGGRVTIGSFTASTVTNATQIDQVLSSSGSTTTPLIIVASYGYVSNAFLANLIISNSTPLPNLGYIMEFDDGVNLGLTGSAHLPVYFNNIYVYPLATNGVTITTMGILSGQRVFGSGSYIGGAALGLETRATIGQFYSTTIECTNAGASSETFTYAANDDCTNVFNDCTFIARNGVSDNQNIIQWVRSETIYNKCSFNISGPSGSVNTVLNLAETPSRGIFNHCTFNLAYTNSPVMAQLVSFVQDSGTVEFNDCYVFPPTNGVIIDNSSFTGTKITIRDGNIVPSNIKTINANVTFINSGISQLSANVPVGFNPDPTLSYNQRFVTNITAGVVKLNALTNVPSAWFDFTCELTNSHGSGGPFAIVFPPNVRTNIAGTVQQLTNQTYVRFSGVGGQYTNGFSQPQQ